MHAARAHGQRGTFHLPEVTNEQFYRYLMDVGVNVGVIMVLIIAVFLVRQRPANAISGSSTST